MEKEMKASTDPTACCFPSFPSFVTGGRFRRIRYLFWRIRYRKERAECRRRWQEIVEESERLCMEALQDKEQYGERPLFIDMGYGLRMPVPIGKPGNRWEVGVTELKDGTIVPTVKEVRPEE